MVQQEIKTIAGKGASVVLVLDNSGSMALGEGSKTPATYAREALKAFANQFLNGNNSKNKLGLVSYHGGIGPQFDAYDDIEYITKNSLTNDPDVYCDVVDRLLQPSGETNVQMGIKVARDILGADSSDNLKYIVLFSDGAANKSANPTGAEALGKSFISPYSHNGKDYDTSFKFTAFDYSTNGGSTYDDGTYSVSFGDNVTVQMLAAISESFLAEQEGITIYSVFYANPKLSDLEYGGGVFTIKNCASSGQYTEIDKDSANDFADIFIEIERKIVESISPWSIEDPMGSFISFEGFAGGQTPPGASFDTKTNTLHWNMRAPGVTPVYEDGTYRYSLSYTITLQSSGAGFDESKSYPTNGTTTLTYQKLTGTETSEEKTVHFHVPEVMPIGDHSNPAQSTAIVSFRIVNGTWSDGTSGDRTVRVNLPGGLGTLSHADVPTGMQPKAKFAGGSWDVMPNTSINGITGSVTYTFTFQPVLTVTPLSMVDYVIDGPHAGSESNDHFPSVMIETITLGNDDTNIKSTLPLDLVAQIAEQYAFYFVTDSITMATEANPTKGVNGDGSTDAEGYIVKPETMGQYVIKAKPNAKLEIDSYPLILHEAVLMTRPTKEQNTNTPITNDKIDYPVTKPEARMEEGTVLKNSAGIKLSETKCSGVNLLWSKLVDDAEGYQTEYQQLMEAINSKLVSLNFSNHPDHFMAFRLGMVDSNNGNIKLVSGKNQYLTITLPYPENMSQSTNQKYVVLHYIEDLNELHNPFDYELQNPEVITPVKTEYGLQFRVDNFSPFVLAWVNQYTILSTAGEGGSITPAGNTVVDEGGKQSYIITPSDGYRIADVLVNGTSVGAVSSYQFLDVKTDHTIHATFSKTGGGSGGGSGSGSGGTNGYLNVTNVDVDSCVTLPGAQYELYQVNKEGVESKIGTYTIGANGEVRVNVLPNGSYYLKEILPSAGYILNQDVVKFEYIGGVKEITIGSRKAGVPDGLNSVDHMAYIIGFEDGLVKPLHSITRAEVATMFYRLLKTDVRDYIFTVEPSFRDVRVSDWYNKAVSSMARGEYIYGYPDHSFKANQAITRAEFVAMAVRFMPKQTIATSAFQDVDRNHWAKEAIDTAVYYGWIQGHEGAFRPDDPITRAEAMTITNRMLNRKLNEEGLIHGYKDWEDNEKDAWYYYDVIEATSAHEYTMNPSAETWTSLLQNNVWLDKTKYEDPNQ